VSLYGRYGYEPKTSMERWELQAEIELEREETDLWNQQQNIRYKEAPSGKPPASDSVPLPD